MIILLKMDLIRYGYPNKKSDNKLKLQSECIKYNWWFQIWISLGKIDQKLQKVNFYKPKTKSLYPIWYVTSGIFNIFCLI